MKTKPRIRRIPPFPFDPSYRMWECKDGTIRGRGMSPKDAYAEWVKKVSNG